MEKRQSLQLGCWENWTARPKRMKVEHSLTSYTDVNSTWINVPIVRLDIMQYLEEYLGRTI